MMRLLCASFWAVLLMGCGGGSSDSSSVAADAIDKYVGTWVSECRSESDIWMTDSRVATRQMQTLEISKASSNTANYQTTLTVFPIEDVNCTGRPIATISKTGSTAGEVWSGSILTSGYGKNTIAYLGEATLSNGLKIDKLTVSESKLTSISGEFSLGPITTHAGYYEDIVGLQLAAQFKSSDRILFNPYQGDVPTTMVDYSTLTWTKK